MNRLTIELGQKAVDLGDVLRRNRYLYKLVFSHCWTWLAVYKRDNGASRIARCRAGGAVTRGLLTNRPGATYMGVLDDPSLANRSRSALWMLCRSLSVRSGAWCTS